MNRLLPALLASLMITPQALACGGFFCSSVPIDQSKERIIFAVDEPAGTVETHVQIFYQGTAAEFAWIVPVPSVPDIALSVDALFQNLEWQTAPQFALQTEFVGDCEIFYPPMMEDAPSDEDDSDTAGGVTVVAQSQVGPYETVTLAATDADELITWLNDNQYIIPDAVASHLAPYVADGSFFIALRLSNDRDAGDIAPIKFTYEATAAMIPLVLTAIAATPDMRLQPYVFAQHRAVPDDYLHVQVNEAAINWLSYGSNYDAVITQAANEAGGQAFATDFSGPTEAFRGGLWREGQYDLDLLAATDDPAAFVSNMLSMGFPRTPQVQNLIREFIPMPPAATADGLDESSFYNCLDCYPEYTSQVDFHPAAFATALGTLIVTPLEQAESLFWDHPTVTRMTSSMSADEMTRDPHFVLNADMGEVSNVHVATRFIDCTANPDDTSTWSSWIELADGRTILLPPGSADYMYGGGPELDDALTDVAASVIEDAGPTGEPVTVTDNAALIDAALDVYNAEIAAQYDAAGLELPDGLKATTTDGCGGCDSGGPTGLTGAALALTGLLLRRRR